MLITSKLNKNETLEKNEAQLSIERAEKLVFIYCNAASLDNIYHNDYLADFLFV